MIFTRGVSVFLHCWSQSRSFFFYWGCVCIFAGPDIITSGVSVFLQERSQGLSFSLGAYSCFLQDAARACLFIGGVFVFLLGVAVMPHDPAYESFWAYMGLSFGQGLVTGKPDRLSQ